MGILTKLLVAVLATALAVGVLSYPAVGEWLSRQHDLIRLALPLLVGAGFAIGMIELFGL